MTAASVTVIDRVPTTLSVSPEQALAYCRRVLVGWDERPWEANGEVVGAIFTRADFCFVMMPGRAEFADYGRRMVEVCEEMVALGIVRQPSEALLAMAAEPAGGADSHGAVREVPAREAMAAVSPTGGERSTCRCRACDPPKLIGGRFYVCADCGNKRCPHATDHRHACTRSNEPGQEGSAYR